MSNAIRYGFLIFTAIITIVGFSILISSVNNGLDSASEYLVSMGGSMDSESFRIIQDGYILSNIILGGIMLFVGLSFFCLGIFQFSRELQ